MESDLAMRVLPRELAADALVCEAIRRAALANRTRPAACDWPPHASPQQRKQFDDWCARIDASAASVARGEVAFDDF